MTKLKPCPFCGGAVRIWSSGRLNAFVVDHRNLNDCAFCEFHIPWEIGETLQQATELWNRRSNND